MKKILGLDIGVASIGWAMIERNQDYSKGKILKAGVRVVPMAPDERDNFYKGQTSTVSQDRTTKRQARRNLQRFKLRRHQLIKFFKDQGVELTQELIHLPKDKIWQLRANAVTQKISPEELLRVLLHLNSKRGYKSSRKSAEGGENKKSEYLQAIINNQSSLKEKTIGQKIHQELSKNPHYRYKGKIFYREDYLNEFDSVITQQKVHYPKLLTESSIRKIKNEIIFYQRPLKSCKHLVADCRFEKNNKTIPVSSPLFEITRIWQSVNQLEFDQYKLKINIKPTQEQKEHLVQLLLKSKELSKSNLIKEMGLTKDYKCNLEKIIGHRTFFKLRKAIEDKVPQALEDGTLDKFFKFDPSLPLEQQESYQLWHLLYSIDDLLVTERALKKKFNLSDEVISAIVDIQFQQGYGSLSAKALRKIVPYLSQGFLYSDACEKAGYRHSDYLTKEENLERSLDEQLANVKRSELRNPVVEKIINQTINLVNEILKHPHLGRPDEIRVELARDLRMNSEERKNHYKRQNESEKRNKEVKETLEKYFKKEGMTTSVSLKDMERLKLYEEIGGVSIYTGKKLKLSDLLNGSLEVEHIIPRSRLFDDSFGNKTICEREVNQAKGSMTAFEFMKSRSEKEFEAFQERVHRLADEGKISHKKMRHLLMPGDQIPKDFISRNLNDTRYISREIKKRLNRICRHVESTTGQITDLLRHHWGIDEILKNAHFKIYKEHGLAHVEEREDGSKKKIISKDDWVWSKREDHRHHAMDAITIACTQQSVIQKLNQLPELYHAQKLTDKKIYQFSDPWDGFTKEVQQTIETMAISFKSGKKAYTVNRLKNKKAKVNEKYKKVIVPRGALHEESVYGLVQVKESVVLDKKITLAQVDAIIDLDLKKIVLAHLEQHQKDPVIAFSTKVLKKTPVMYLGKIVNEVEVYESKVTLRYELGVNFKEKDAEFIVDDRVKAVVIQRLKEHGGQSKNAFKDLDNNPIYLDQKAGLTIKRVKCFTGLDKSKLVALHDVGGKEVDFVKPGNNHHIILYRDPEGEIHEEVVTFFDVVQRKLRGEPTIKKQHENGWQYVTHMMQNEMFVFDMTPDELQTAIAQHKNDLIMKNLYRVQKIANRDYTFRKQIETSVDDKVLGDALSKEIGKLKRISALNNMTGIKVYISRLGDIRLSD
jgi:CRISPR-associated endonuclease Csn1